MDKPSTSIATVNNKKIQAAVNNLNKLGIEQRNLSQKLNELEGDAAEHRLVIDALKEVNGERTCYRLVSGVLLQSTVNEILPELEQSLSMLRNTANQFRTKIKDKGQEMNELIKQNNLGPMIRAQNGARIEESIDEEKEKSDSKIDDLKKPSTSVLVE
ncbi:Prefoldin subunit 2 [Sarcoptes scabiei]|uniref:Prefoldin subunit 2 n=1 Tax=Sarcoptes scabiei TaxID=52283 RepID=A0A132A5I7_SARSC|nr:Prefoldin subunit 2 [Sarcoptes scabiei]KPM05690.1 prefoldin subunit 2-like protein [Sarcoptes scabiei]